MRHPCSAVRASLCCGIVLFLAGLGCGGSGGKATTTDAATTDGNGGTPAGGSGGSAAGGSGGSAAGGSGGSPAGGSGGTPATGGAGGVGDCSGASSAVTTVATLPDVVRTLLVDDSHAYVLMGEPGSEPLQSSTGLARVPLSGGAPQILYSNRVSPSPIQTGPAGLALDASNVYWTTGTGALNKVAKSAGAVTLLAMIAPTNSLNSSGGVAADGTSVYWSTKDAIMKIPANGGTGTKIVASSAAGLWFDDAHLFWNSYDNFADVDSLMTAPIQGGTATTLTSMSMPIGAVALDAEWVYYLSGDGTLSKVKKSGGTPVVLAAGVPDMFTTESNIVVDATYVYWVNDYKGPRKVLKAGGSVIPLTDERNGASQIAVDGCNVYWITGGITGKQQLVKTKK